MENRRIIIIAMDQPLDSDSQLRSKMLNVEKRAARQSSRFSGLDLGNIQKEVNQNLMKLPLCFEGCFMGLPDLMNYIKNKHRFPDITKENASDYYLFANGFSLNGVYLYQYLLRGGYDPLVIQNYSLVDIGKILEEKPLAVCISSTFLYLDDIKKIAERIKGIDPDIPVIVGGILAKKIMDAGLNMAHQTMKWLSSFRGLLDAFVIESHGEETLLRLLKILRNGRDPGKVPNLGLFDEKGRLFFTLRETEPVDMDRTAIAWDEMPKQYLRPTLSVITSQGCHYRCRFCTYHRWFPKVHYKSIDVLKDELLLIGKLGFVKHVRFADDNFTADKKRMKSVLEMMVREKFDFTWSAFARAGTITPETAGLMKESGCEFINMGIESGSREILKIMDKKLDPDQSFEAVQLLKNQGIYTLGGFIIGYPGETRETFFETIDLINKSGLDYYHPYLFYYSKSMLVHQEEEKFGIKGVGWAWKHNTMDAVEASDLMSQMINILDHACTDGQQKTWETFKLLRGEGYPGGDILELHRLKRELQISVGNCKKTQSNSDEVNEILRKMGKIIKGS